MIINSGTPCGSTVPCFYIADYSNNRIRSVVVSTGVIATAAGNGTYGDSGDGGQRATSAELKEPIGVAVDSSGNLYIADTYNCRIRKVVATTGMITTVAGYNTSYCYYGRSLTGQATSATFTPSAVALDSSGNIYIADGSSQDNCILKVTATTGIITDVAGYTEPAIGTLRLQRAGHYR